MKNPTAARVSTVGFSKFNTPHQVMIDHPIAKMGGVLNK